VFVDAPDPLGVCPGAVELRVDGADLNDFIATRDLVCRTGSVDMAAGDHEVCVRRMGTIDVAGVGIFVER
jgi:hypothetical protein